MTDNLKLMLFNVLIWSIFEQ